MGGLHEVKRAGELLADGEDLVAIGRGALANPDLPNRLKAQSLLRDFDPETLGPIANIKESELAL